MLWCFYNFDGLNTFFFGSWATLTTLTNILQVVVWLVGVNKLAEALQLQKEEWGISFQSRLGFAKWLSPYTSETLEKWAGENIKHVDVICPAFAADCLETLEEIEDENRELFIEAGGEVFNLVPCLNEDDLHIEMMADIADKYLPRQD